MWSFLRRNQEPSLVGTAITLVILALLIHLRPTDTSTASNPSMLVPTTTDRWVKGGGLNDIPREHEYYRAKWRQIANDFYAANPVPTDKAISTTTVPVITASLSDRRSVDNIAVSNDDTAVDGNVAVDAETTTSDGVVSPSMVTPSLVTPVSHVTAATASTSLPPMSVSAAPTAQSSGNGTLVVRPRTAFAGKPAVAAALAAGLLAFLLFRSTWPANTAEALKSRNQIVEGPASLRIELPAHWVSVRPRLRQRLKPIVLTASYVAASVAAWSIYR